MKFVRNISVKIGADEYNGEVSECRVEPTEVSWKGGTDTARYSDFTYKLTLKLAHDYQNAASLFNFLLEHAGEAAIFAYMPDLAGEFTATVTAQVVPPTIGGPVDNYNESTITMSCSQPTLAVLTP